MAKDMSGSKPDSDDKEIKKRNVQNKGNADAVKDEPKDELSGKKESIKVNPTLEEAVASIRNKLINVIGASSRRQKQWLTFPEGKIRVEVFEDGKALFVRFTGEKLDPSFAKEKFLEIRRDIRMYAAKNKIPLIKAAPKIPDSVLGVEHISLGSYVESKQTMTVEISKPAKG